MRKYIKLLTMLLAVVLMLQAAPLVALGDDVDSGTYTDDGQDTTNDTASELEETDEPETDTPAEPAVDVTNVQWRKNGTNDAFTDLADGQAVAVNEILFRLTFTEKLSSLTVKVDGVEVETTAMLNFAFVTVEVINGDHVMEVAMESAGGSAVKRISFRTEGESTYPSFELEAPADLLRGETAEIKLGGANLDKVDSLSLTIAIDRSFDVEEVILPDGVDGMYMWYRGELTIVADVVDSTLLTDDGLAVIRITTPNDVEAEDFAWTILSSEVTLTEDSGLGGSGDFIGGVQIETPEIGVSYAYTVEILGSFVKGTEYTVVVKHYDGTPAAGASVYALLDGESLLVGTTDGDGLLKTVFFDTEDAYTVYALAEDGAQSETVSFSCVTPVGDESGVPYGISFNAPVFNGKSISWMSHLLASSENAVLRLSTVPTMSNAVEINGTSVVTYYNDGTRVNRVNTATVTDLAPGFTYYYQIGDGSVWSEVASFTVAVPSDTQNLVVLGDVVGSANMGLVTNAISQSGIAYDFALQTGGMLADPNDYNGWDALTGGLSLDTLHTLSSAELDNETVRLMYGLSDALYYSYEMGNVYVAVINATDDEAALKQALADMYADAKASSCAWKLLTVHTPVYSTDAALDNAMIASVLPYFVERAGIDVVFSGATGSYSRTDKLLQDAVTEKNGVTYVTVGSLGYKSESYEADDRFAFATNEFNAMYLSVTATADALTVTACNVAEDGTVSELDRFTLTPVICAEHEHAYRINYDVGELICDHCDSRTDLNEYVGPVWLGDSLYYLENGAYKNGWIEYYGDTYYFSPRAVDGEATVGGYTYVFENYVLKRGAWFERDGITMLKWAGVTQKSTWITMEGKTYYFRSNGAYVTGVVSVPVTNESGVVVYEYHRFDENGVHQGRLEDGLYVDDTLIIYTLNGVAQHAGLVMDEDGSFYYISSSGEGVRNVTRAISAAWTNGLLPEGVYTFGADGKMIDPPVDGE